MNTKPLLGVLRQTARSSGGFATNSNHPIERLATLELTDLCGVLGGVVRPLLLESALQLRGAFFQKLPLLSGAQRHEALVR